MFGRATIRLGIGPHSSSRMISDFYQLSLVSDIAVFVLKRDVKLQLTHQLSLSVSTKPLGMQASIFGACPKPG